MQSQPPGAKYPPYTGRGLAQVSGEKTGFFHVEELDGKWWLIDPNGRALLFLSVEHVNYTLMRCTATGRAPYHEFVSEKYGGEQAWAEATAARLLDWGFCVLGGGCSESLYYRGLPHVRSYHAYGFAKIDDLTPQTWWTGFPNVFSPEWPAFCDERAREACAPNRDDPWLIGYFLDNELQWYGDFGEDTPVHPLGLVKAVWGKPADHTAKQALVKLARERFPSIQDFNAAWGTSYSSYDEITGATVYPEAPSEEARLMARDFIRQVAELYFRETTQAIRRHDPNHMILGVRIAEIGPDIWDINGRYCDVVSLNKYPDVDVARGVSRELVAFFQEIHDRSRRPMAITEWNIVAQSDDFAVPPWDAVGMRVFDQKQRADCAVSFQQTLLSLPFMLGSSWWMYTDCPLDASESEPLNDNCGLVSRRDEPYEEVVAAFREVNGRAADVHVAGEQNTIYDPLPAARWNQPFPRRELQLTEAATALRSGAIELALRDDRAAWNVQYEGRPVAAFSPALLRGATTGTRIQPALWSVKGARRDEQFTVVEAELESEASDGSAFKSGWRLWAPRSSSGWCGAQCVWLENAGAAALHAGALVYWAHVADGGPEDVGVLSPANAQRFYLPLGALDHPEDRVGFGITLVEGGAEFVHVRPSDSPPSSCCRQALDLHLEPGRRQQVDGPVVLLFGYRAEGPSQLLGALKQQVERVREEALRYCASREPGEAS